MIFYDSQETSSLVLVQRGQLDNDSPQSYLGMLLM